MCIVVIHTKPNPRHAHRPMMTTTTIPHTNEHPSRAAKAPQRNDEDGSEREREQEQERAASKRRCVDRKQTNKQSNLSSILVAKKIFFHGRITPF
jgi:hypothetical protein